MTRTHTLLSPSQILYQLSYISRYCMFFKFFFEFVNYIAILIYCGVLLYTSYFSSNVNNQTFKLFKIIVGFLMFSCLYNLLYLNTNTFTIDALFIFSSSVLLYKIIFILSILLFLLVIQVSNLTYINVNLFIFIILNFILVTCGIFHSTHFFITFFCFEFQSFLIFILLSLTRYSYDSLNGVFYYFLLSSFFTIYFLSSLIYIFITFNSLNFTTISMAILTILNNSSFFSLKYLFLQYSILSLLLVLLFKTASFPFHFWIRETYMGALFIVLGFITTITKFPYIYFLLQISHICHLNQTLPFYYWLFLGCGIGSIIYGIFLTLQQQTIKIFLIYSSITHMGFIFFLLVSYQNFLNLATIFSYLINYTLTLTVVWGILSYIPLKEHDLIPGNNNFALTDLNQFFKQNKILGLIFSFALISLAGIPPFGGFFFKVNVFLVLLNNHEYFILSGILILSGIIIYYYLKILKLIFFNKSLIFYDIKQTIKEYNYTEFQFKTLIKIILYISSSFIFYYIFNFIGTLCAIRFISILSLIL